MLLVEPDKVPAKIVVSNINEKNGGPKDK